MARHSCKPRSPMSTGYDLSWLLLAGLTGRMPAVIKAGDDLHHRRSGSDEGAADR